MSVTTQHSINYVVIRIKYYAVRYVMVVQSKHLQLTQPLCGDQSSVSEHAKLVGHRALLHAKSFDEFGDRQRTVAMKDEYDLETLRMAKHAQQARGR